MFGFSEASASGLQESQLDSDEDKENNAPTAPPWLKKQRLSSDSPPVERASLSPSTTTPLSVGGNVSGSKRSEIIRSIR